MKAVWANNPLWFTYYLFTTAQLSSCLRKNSKLHPSQAADQQNDETPRKQHGAEAGSCLVKLI